MTNIERINLEPLELCFLSSRNPLTVQKFEAINKKGKFGDYLYGYKVSLSNTDGGLYSVELKKSSELYAAIHSCTIVGIKTLVFEKEAGSDRILVSAAVQK